VRRRLPVALVLAAVLAVPACSADGPTAGSGRPGPSSPARTSANTPAATPPATAAPSATGPGSTPAPGRLSAWKGCGGGFQCAVLTVRLDEAEPAKGTVGLALTRHRATGGSRVGSLLVNPGGPGVSAVGYLQAVYSSLPRPLRQRFDLVAFDPRGVGRSAPVRCLTTPELDAYWHLDPEPDNARELAALDAGNRTFVSGCTRRSGRVLPYVSTRTAAEDMDRVRQAVGDTKLTYLGYSYGTALGASYLEQFPTRVRAMVLDGAIDPSLTWAQLLTGQSGGFEGAFDAFLADCDKRGCAFRRTVTGDLGAAFDRLARRVDTRPLPGDADRTVGPGEFQLGVGQALYSRRLWPVLGQALAAAQQGEGGPLLELADAYLDRTGRGYANTLEAINAVNCIDRPWPRTLKPYQELAAEVGRRYPRFGPSIALSGIVCGVWPVPPVSTPHQVTAAGGPPVVVIGTTRDPATPYSWAVALADQLAQGVLLTHVGDGHTAYHGGAARCIVDPVNAYLVSLRVPSATRC
jgi:pimeloyl-ACP methyl ester carboxylesterase